LWWSNRCGSSLYASRRGSKKRSTGARACPVSLLFPPCRPVAASRRKKIKEKREGARALTATPSEAHCFSVPEWRAEKGPRRRPRTSMFLSSQRLENEKEQRRKERRAPSKGKKKAFPPPRPSVVVRPPSKKNGKGCCREKKKIHTHLTRVRGERGSAFTSWQRPSWPPSWPPS
jgi:hypothetical protein